MREKYRVDQECQCWKDVVDFGNCGSVIDRSNSGAL